jgi:hypothetical protein
MPEPKLRTIKITRNRSRFTRAAVTKAMKYAMEIHGQLSAPKKTVRKKAAASQK